VGVVEYTFSPFSRSYTAVFWGTQVEGIWSDDMKKTFGNIAVLTALVLVGISGASANATSTLGLNVPQLGLAKTYAVLTATRIENNGFTNTASTTAGNDLGISTANDTP
jgi:hypothetical protein